MAEGILITVVLMFSLRGLFLGFVGVISKVVGFILAYYMAYNYREVASSFLAGFLGNDSDSSLVLILPIVSSLLLFFGTMIVTGLIISAIFKSLAAIVPPLKAFSENKSIGGKLLGAITNGAIGAILVLVGIWGYGLTLGNATHQSPTSLSDDKLQIAANTVGEFLFSNFKNNSDLNIQTTTQSTTYDSDNGTRSSYSSQTIIEHGSAVIISEENPEKKLSINTVREIIDNNIENNEANSNQLNLLNNSTVTTIMNNPELQELALKHMQENPEKIKAILENPKLKELLEQLNKQ